MMKYLLGILLAALLGVGLWGWNATNRAVAAQTQADQYQRSLMLSEASVKALVENAANTEKALTARAVYAEALLVKRKKENATLAAALKANRDWAAVPIPDGVFDALRGSDTDGKAIPTREPVAPLPSPSAGGEHERRPSSGLP